MTLRLRYLTWKLRALMWLLRRLRAGRGRRILLPWMLPQRNPGSIAMVRKYSK
jgi:hypothetical protein